MEMVSKLATITRSRDVAIQSQNRSIPLYPGIFELGI
jgi:hypothetical protein